MRIFKSKRFARFARKERISDGKLCKAVKDAERGLIDADYGGGVIKQRIARPNEGKSGGYRSIILFRRGRRSFLFMVLPRASRRTSTKATNGTSRSLGEYFWRLRMKT